MQSHYLLEPRPPKAEQLLLRTAHVPMDKRTQTGAAKRLPTSAVRVTHLYLQFEGRILTEAAYSLCSSLPWELAPSRHIDSAAGREQFHSLERIIGHFS